MPNVCDYCGAEYDTAHTCGGVPLLSHINDMPLALKRIGELEAENAKLSARVAELEETISGAWAAIMHGDIDEALQGLGDSIEAALRGGEEE